MTNNNNNIRETIKNKITNFVNNEYRTVEDMVFTNGAVIRLGKNESNTINVSVLTSVDGVQTWGLDQYCLKTVEEVTDAVMNICENKYSSLPMLADHKVRRGEHAIEYVTKAICEARSEKDNELQQIYVVPELDNTLIVNCHEDESWLYCWHNGLSSEYAFNVNQIEDWEDIYNWIEQRFQIANSKENLPETLGELVDRFASDDEYAAKLINDEVEQDDFSDLYNVICGGLAEKYSVMTGKELHEVDALVIANKLIENRCDELGINCVVDSIEKKVYWLTCTDENGEPLDTFKNFKANTLPFVVKMAEAKANAMCVKIA